MVGLLSLMVIPILALGGNMRLQAPTYSGRLPLGVDRGFAARLDKACGQYLMSSRGGTLVAFAFEDGGFVPRCSLPLPAPIAAPDGGSPLATGRVAAAGDVDGDSSDEIVVAGSRTIRKYKLIRGAVALTAEAHLGPTPDTRPAWCFDVCIGDVNQDGVNEILLAGVQGLAPFEPDRIDRPVTLYVCRWIGDRLAPKWNDHGALDLEGPSWVTPITEMVGFYDPTNLGHPRLLMAEGKSDVSASMFDGLRWTSNGLDSEGSFVIRDGMIRRNVPDDNPASSAIRCDFAQIGGRTAVLASMLREEDQWPGEYFVFNGDTAAEHRVLWLDSGFDWWKPSAGIIIDLDGKGAGALRFRHPRPNEGGPTFEFYRL